MYIRLTSIDDGKLDDLGTVLDFVTLLKQGKDIGVRPFIMTFDLGSGPGLELIDQGTR